MSNVLGVDVLNRRGYIGYFPLDSGGQANVYRSTNKNGNPVAIKVIKIDAHKEGKIDADMQRELSIMNQVEHPNCIDVLDIFRTKKLMFVVMPLMSNGSLGSKVRKEGPLNQFIIRVLFPPIVRAVKYLNDRDIAHRDLKLDNILLDDSLNPKVSDFGYAILVDRDERTNAVQMTRTQCGTPSHMAPEILMGVPYNALQVDPWCLGIMLFILTNQIYPFDRKISDKERLQKQLQRKYALQPEIMKNLDPKQKDLIDKLLEPKPELRLTSAQICAHEWFPVVYKETEVFRLAQERKSKTSSKSDPPGGNVQKTQSPK